MAYRAKCCGVEVYGRLVLVGIVLGVPVIEERCPGCGEWTEFVPATDAAIATPRRKAA